MYLFRFLIDGCCEHVVWVRLESLVRMSQLLHLSACSHENNRRAAERIFTNSFVFWGITRRKVRRQFDP